MINDDFGLGPSSPQLCQCPVAASGQRSEGCDVVRTAACSCTRVIYGKAPPPLCVPAAGPCTWTLSHCLSPLSPVYRHCQETLQLQHGLTERWNVEL